MTENGAHVTENGAAASREARAQLLQQSVAGQKYVPFAVGNGRMVLLVLMVEYAV